MTTERPITDGPTRLVLGAVVAASGAASLLLQTTWQRVIALHSGVDLASSTTVVAAFLGGLGIGSLVGGRIADRVGPRRALRLLAATTAGVAGCALVSTAVLYDLYRALAPHLGSTLGRFGFNSVALLLPTTLLGASLPLVARSVTGDAAHAGAVVGRFHAANVLGAAAGAMAASWALLGIFGLVGATRLAAAVLLVVAGLLLAVAGSGTPSARMAGLVSGAAGALLAVGAVAWYVAARTEVVRTWEPPVALLVLGLGLVAAGCGAVLMRSAATSSAEAPRRPDGAVPADDVHTDAHGATPSVVSTPRAAGAATQDEVGRRVGVWYLAYGLTGAAALGYEQVFFRLIDGVMRSNSITFGHVLGLYLLLLAAGGAVGAVLVGRARDPARWFGWIQVGVGLSSLLTLAALFGLLPHLGLETAYSRWFSADGFAAGVDVGSTSDAVVFGLVVPLFLMLPVGLMGAGFPFVQRLVTRDLATLGRGTGGLVASNLVGNVAGALLAGFVLIDRWGVVGTYLALSIPLVLAGLLAARRAPSPGRRVGESVAVVVALAVAVVAVPGNAQLWADLNGTPVDRMLVAEDRSCASGLKLFGDSSQLTLNGTTQNGHPFDDFHVLIGLLPALAHPDPRRAAAVGFGIGSTSYALLASGRVDEVTSIELCGGNYDIARRLAADGEPDFVRLVEDPAHRMVVGDGRTFLLAQDEDLDIIVPDHSRTTSAGAGNLYSREFVALMAEHLGSDGMATGWIPTYRVQNAVMTEMPYSVAVTVGSYNDSRMFLASRSPIDLDPETLLERFDAVAEAFPPAQRASLRALLADLDAECLTDGETAPTPRAGAENRDLFPRDEYFLANAPIGDAEATPRC